MDWMDNVNCIDEWTDYGGFGFIVSVKYPPSGNYKKRLKSRRRSSRPQKLGGEEGDDEADDNGSRMKMRPKRQYALSLFSFPHHPKAPSYYY
jgi:hypothetical protein